MAQAAVTDEQQVAADEESDESCVEQALDRRSERGFTGQDVEDRRDGTRDDDDYRELPAPNPCAGRPHAATSIAPAARGGQRARYHPGQECLAATQR